VARSDHQRYVQFEFFYVSFFLTFQTDPEMPHYYKMALFNELYFVTDGGTIWTNGCPADPEHERKHCQSEENYMGHFAYLEGHEYLMLNTYDVHFYASFALAMLWPMLELSLQVRTLTKLFLPYMEAHMVYTLEGYWQGHPARNSDPENGAAYRRYDGA
jgi:uncharacterized protein (DUF608 family)